MDDILYNKVPNWYKIEELPSNTDVRKSESNRRSSEIFESTVEFKEGRYQLGILRENNPDLPSNFPLAFKQLNAQLKLLERPGTAGEIHQIIEEDQKVEEVPLHKTTSNSTPWHNPKQKNQNFERSIKISWNINE